MADVALRNVVKRFDDVDAVRNISLTIPDNEFVVLVGPSGCGKSTTLRMIAGLEEATAGDILIDGEVVNDVPPKDRDIAMVFQNYALYPHMTVFENMSFGLRLRRIPKAEIRARVEQAAKILDITDLLGRRPKQLSGGQRQRVAMGRAIVRNPKVFLFDEPLSNLDAKLRVQMRTEIKRVHQKVKMPGACFRPRRSPRPRTASGSATICHFRSASEQLAPQHDRAIEGGFRGKAARHVHGTGSRPQARRSHALRLESARRAWRRAASRLLARRGPSGEDHNHASAARRSHRRQTRARGSPLGSPVSSVAGPSTLRARMTIENRSASAEETWLGESSELSKTHPIRTAASAWRA
jgi:ABC-type nitrate/sulfonate/bicarbonate transport system ATPase subunit